MANTSQSSKATLVWGQPYENAECAAHEVCIAWGQPGGDPSNTDGSFSLCRELSREAVCDMACGWGRPCTGPSCLLAL